MKTLNTALAAFASALILGGGGAANAAESALHVVFCKATIAGNYNRDYISVTLPPTDGYFDNQGNPLTFWDVGRVPVGGVADSWHADGGPGRFTARNESNCGAYVYVTTSGDSYQRFYGKNGGNGEYYCSGTAASTNVWGYVERGQFGCIEMLRNPAISPAELRRWGEDYGSYHLAFTTDVTAKVPTWHSLDHRYNGNRWTTEELSNASDAMAYEVAGYMGYVDAGDYITFDLKFWAPTWWDNSEDMPVLFTFCVEAAPFRLWDHGRAVE